MTILFGTGCVLGAVYRPVLSIVPRVELPPATGVPVPMLTSQLTRSLLRFRRFLVHCAVPFTVNEVPVPEVGTHEMVSDGVGGGVLELPPPQEFRTSSAGRSAKTGSRRCHPTVGRHKDPFG